MHCGVGHGKALTGDADRAYELINQIDFEIGHVDTLSVVPLIAPVVTWISEIGGI